MEKVSFKKLIKNDSYTVSLFFTFIVMLILLVIFYFRPDSVNDYGLYGVVGLSVLLVIVLVFRLLRILSFKPQNKVHKAKVIKAFSYRSSKHIKFTYNVDGVDYICKNVLFSSKFSRALFKDDQVEIYISQTNPARALLKEAYFETEL